MRLLKTTKSEEGKFEVKVFTDEQLRDLQYAILSHTWGTDEVTLDSINHHSVRSSMGYKKIEQCCSVARTMEYEYVWIDTCCIDKSSSAELSEAINSMFAWYQEAKICFAYLSDVPGVPFQRSKWFTRGWTLQELIAPRNVIFFDGGWRELGDKRSLGKRISECTRIPESVLLRKKDLNMFSAAQRMSWAAERETTRVEDRAYCLLGLFGVNMPLIYGEREAAFIRLQEEILRVSEDHSLFAWKSSDTCSGLLATSPLAFIDSHDIVPCETFETSSGPLIISGRGIHLDLCLIGLEHAGLALAVLECRRIDGENTSVAIFVHDPSMTLERFKRVNCDNFVHIKLKRYKKNQYRMTRMCIQASHLTHFQAPKDSEGYNSFSPIQIYPKSKRTGTIDWRSPDAEVHLWLSIVCGGFEAVLNSVSNGRTPLMWAAENGLEKYVIMLIKRGAATELDNNMVDTPLSLASRNGHSAIVKLLLDNGATPVTDSRGRIPVTYRSQVGHEQILRLLIDNGADLDAKDLQGYTPLTCAIWADNVPVIELLLDKGANINAEDQYRRTPLVSAILANNMSIIKVLLDKGANIDAEDQYRRTPLVSAIRADNVSIVKILLDNGAKIETKSRDGYTPLAYAVIDGNISIIKILLDLGANKDTKDQFGYTPLSYAIGDDKVSIVETLLDHGADINIKLQYGYPPLVHAIRERKVTMVKVLLDKGVDIYQVDKDGRTALILAIVTKDQTIVKMLLEKGADTTITDLDGNTPLSIATKYRLQSI
ncbi:hypothetical protein AFLA70_157g002641, partial [Aspergillus flavus AF70]